MGLLRLDLPTDSVGGLLSRENLDNLLLLGQDHGADLLGDEGLDPLACVHLLLVELGRLLDRLQRIEFDFILYSLVRPVVTDHPLFPVVAVLQVQTNLSCMIHTGFKDFFTH